MKAAFFLLIFYLVSILPASAAYSSPAGEMSTARIAALYSDLESFDVTLHSDQPEKNLNLEVFLVRPNGINEEILEKETFSVGSLPANTRVMKVGFWNLRGPERGAYAIKARLLSGEKILSEAKYNFVYGSNSASRIQVNDLVPNSQGISVALSPKEASLFDIEYMLVDNSNISYLTKTENLSLTSFPDIFSASWGVILENNKEYVGRVKIQVYSPDKEFIASTENFTARDNAEITDIFQDETGASATVFGRSQVPFEGSLVFSIYELADGSGKGSSRLVESVRERVPVLLNDDDETVEVAWSQRLPKGVYRLEIELLGNDGDIIERRETILESDLSEVSNGSSINNSTTKTEPSQEEGIPGFSAGTLISGFVTIFLLSRKHT
jgi:hypothetical protein